MSDLRTPAIKRPSRSALIGAHHVLDLTSTQVMGVLNVTPDSFSDGGHYAESSKAIERALEMIEEGATIIDIGGESTRPGAQPVAPEIELARVLPVVEGIRRHSQVFVSVDTSEPRVIAAVCEAGADLINDIRSLQRPGSLEAVARAGAAACVMHMQGEPGNMQLDPRYSDVVSEVMTFLDARVVACGERGVGRERVIVDPGFGFGKTLDHNLALMRGLRRLVARGLPVVMGASRKSMFAQLFERDAMASRINGSLGAAFWGVQQGVSIIRSHDVRETAEMALLASTLVADIHD
ncbi:MAG: dihydropteroate synthase [Salinisphaera sp.]|jgi:dihydropteroate synthase|nr:dihydropteroate synthase [Salinisphaera sp.]